MTDITALKSRKINRDFFINGRYVLYENTEGGTYTFKNPCSNVSLDGISPFPVANQAITEVAIGAARNAFDTGPWPRMSLKERAGILRKMAELIKRDAMFLGFLEAWSIGKVLKASVDYEIPRAANNFSEFADTIESWRDEKWLKPGVSYLGEKVDIYSFSKRQPIGVGGVIIPWNAPIMHGTWKVAPCLAAGNTCVLKPPMCGALGVLQLGEIANEAGLPPGVLNIIPGEKEAGKALVRSANINKISFTGGDITGMMVNIMNAETRFIPPSFELGGKSPQIVFADVDIDAAVKGVAHAAFRSAGQSCVTGSRLLIHADIYDAFMKKLVAYVKTMKVGSQFCDDTIIGPLVTQKHLQKVETDVKMALVENVYAKVLIGGARIRENGLSEGNFFPPTILVNVNPLMKIWQEEIFGPVLVVMSFTTEEEAIALANNAKYGLSSNVWTQDQERALRIAEEIDTGMTWINSHFLRDLRAPFGGRKASGNCAESLSESIYSWTQHKMICTLL